MNKLYMIINRSALPGSFYKIALAVWSAGGKWGDNAPERNPIVEMLPRDEIELSKKNPDVIRNFLDLFWNKTGSQKIFGKAW